MVTIEIIGNPIPLQRARAGKHGFYDAQFIAKRNYAHVVKEQYLDTQIDSPIILTVHFYFAMPKSWSIKKKDRMRDKEHIQKPDTTNLVKFVEDSLLGVLWKDDSIIFQLHAYKAWKDEGKTIINVEYKK